MMIMPLVFGGMMFFFPAGLVLYWCVNNTLSILQQWSITRHPAQDRSRRKPLIAEHGNENRPPGAGFSWLRHPGTTAAASTRGGLRMMPLAIPPAAYGACASTHSAYCRTYARRCAQPAAAAAARMAWRSRSRARRS